jgi:hypothetical protein
MTVGELKKALSKFNDDMPVVVGSDDFPVMGKSAMWVIDVFLSPGWKGRESVFFPRLELVELDWPETAATDVDERLRAIYAVPSERLWRRVEENSEDN